MSRQRVYHPETNEPFDLPEAKATELRLNHGWNAAPIDPTAMPAVQDVPVAQEAPSTRKGGRGSAVNVKPPVEAPEADWRDAADETSTDNK